MCFLSYMCIVRLMYIHAYIYIYIFMCIWPPTTTICNDYRFKRRRHEFSVQIFSRYKLMWWVAAVPRTTPVRVSNGCTDTATNCNTPATYCDEMLHIARQCAQHTATDHLCRMAAQRLAAMEEGGK